MGAHSIIALCKRSVRAAFTRADLPPVWHATLPLVSCPRTRCPRPSCAGGPSHGGAQRSARHSSPHAPRCRDGIMAPSRVRPQRGPGARGGADGLPPIPQHRGEEIRRLPFRQPRPCGHPQLAQQRRLFLRRRLLPPGCLGLHEARHPEMPRIVFRQPLRIGQGGGVLKVEMATFKPSVQRHSG